MTTEEKIEVILEYCKKQRSESDACSKCKLFEEGWCCGFKEHKYIPCEALDEEEIDDIYGLLQSGTSKDAVHYQLLQQQPIEIMQTLFSLEEFKGFLRGNIIKYVLRYGHKDDCLKEAEKIAQYAQWLAMAERDETIKP